VARLDGTLDVAVMGAGLIELAVARAPAQRGREVIVLEAERALGMHSSVRNSEVLLAGSPAQDFFIQGPLDHGVPGW